MNILHWLDVARWWMAVLVLISFPPAVLYWYVVHPFVNFWRRQRPTVTLWVLGIGYLVFMVLLIPFRHVLAGRDLGMNVWTFAAGLPLIVISFFIQRARKRHLKFRILSGVPEISPDASESVLLSEGIYGRIRHPRYAEFIVGSIGWALWLNYVGVYLMTAAMIVGILLIVPMEERELRERFGDAYVEYCARVPRFIPKTIR